MFVFCADLTASTKPFLCWAGCQLQVSALSLSKSCYVKPDLIPGLIVNDWFPHWSWFLPWDGICHVISRFPSAFSPWTRHLWKSPEAPHPSESDAQSPTTIINYQSLPDCCFHQFQCPVRLLAFHSGAEGLQWGRRPDFLCLERSKETWPAPPAAPNSPSGWRRVCRRAVWVHRHLALPRFQKHPLQAIALVHGNIKKINAKREELQRFKAVSTRATWLLHLSLWSKLRVKDFWRELKLFQISESGCQKRSQIDLSESNSISVSRQRTPVNWSVVTFFLGQTSSSTCCHAPKYSSSCRAMESTGGKKSRIMLKSMYLSQCSIYLRAESSNVFKWSRIGYQLFPVLSMFTEAWWDWCSLHGVKKHAFNVVVLLVIRCSHRFIARQVLYIPATCAKGIPIGRSLDCPSSG